MHRKIIMGADYTIVYAIDEDGSVWMESNPGGDNPYPVDADVLAPYEWETAKRLTLKGSDR